MREDFDPYYLWLGIPPADQPPDHYRLLGITQFESDADVIRNAAEQRMRYLRTVTGPRAKRAQQLVNEIVAAQRILAEDASREKYNALITESPLAKRRGVSPPAVSTPGFEPPAIDTPSYRRRTRHTRNSEGDDPRRVQVKIVVALIPGVVVVVIGIIWMLAGGDSSSKQGARNDRENKTGSEASPGQGVEKDSLEAARNKTFGNQAENTAAKRPPKPVVKPPKADSQPENSKLDKPSEPRTPASIEEPDDEQSTLEQAEVLLKSKGLEEGFNSKWELTGILNLKEIKNKSPKIASADQNEMAVLFSKFRREIFDNYKARAMHGYSLQDPEFIRLYSLIILIGKKQGNQVLMQFGDAGSYPLPLPPNIKQEPTITIESEFLKWISQKYKPILRREYKSLENDPKIKAALKTVGGTLAEPPVTNAPTEQAEPPVTNAPTEQAEPNRPVALATPAASKMPALANLNPAQRALLERAAADYKQVTRQEFYSLLAKGRDLGRQNGAVFGLRAEDKSRFYFLGWHHPEIGTTALIPQKKSPEPFNQEMRKAVWKAVRNTPAWKEASAEGKQPNAKRESQRSVASFAELKERLTSLEKETKLALGKFNKGAKDYLKKKKDLVKRIKAGEALYAKQAKMQDSLPDGEQKTKFGEETEAKVMKPLKKIKSRLQDLTKPDAAQMEGNLSRVEKLLEQIKATSEYAANSNSTDSVAEKIAKYRKGYEVQQSKMAK